MGARGGYRTPSRCPTPHSSAFFVGTGSSDETSARQEHVLSIRSVVSHCLSEKDYVAVSTRIRFRVVDSSGVATRVRAQAPDSTSHGVNHGESGTLAETPQTWAGPAGARAWARVAFCDTVYYGRS